MTDNLGLHCSHVTNVVLFMTRLIYERMHAYNSCPLSEQKRSMYPYCLLKCSSNNIYTKHGHWSLDALAAICMKVLVCPYMR